MLESISDKAANVIIVINYYLVAIIVKSCKDCNKPVTTVKCITKETISG
jgi:hypothetical protein